jgi:hypothetical protein
VVQKINTGASLKISDVQVYDMALFMSRELVETVQKAAWPTASYI